MKKRELNIKRTIALGSVDAALAAIQVDTNHVDVYRMKERGR